VFKITVCDFEESWSYSSFVNWKRYLSGNPSSLALTSLIELNFREDESKLEKMSVYGDYFTKFSPKMKIFWLLGGQQGDN